MAANRRRRRRLAVCQRGSLRSDGLHSGALGNGAPAAEYRRCAAAVIEVRDLTECERLLRERGSDISRSDGLLVTRFTAGGETLLALRG